MLLYFYFDIYDDYKASFHGALCSLLWQAANYVEGKGISRELVRLYKRCGRGESQPSDTALSQALGNVLRANDRTIVVLDALDECDNGRLALLEWLSPIASQPYGTLQVICTSRGEPTIDATLKYLMPETAMVSIKQPEVDADIRVYVRSRIHNDTGLQHWRDEPVIQDRMEADLMRRSQGM